MYRLKLVKKIAAAFLFAALFCVAVTSVFGHVNGARANAANATESAAQTRVVGYLPNWSYREYQSIDFSALTHINIAFCNPDSRGEITSGIPDSDLQAIVEKAHINDVKVIAALGGGGYCDDYRSLISSPAKIEALNGKITAFCEQYGLDGIDLDIELGAADSIWNNYGEWVAALRTVCDAHGWLLSTATAQWVAERVSNETFSLFDYVNVMAYDNDSHGSNSHSSYEFAVECLEYFHTRKSVPKEKLVLGVPFYGRGYDESGSLDWSTYVSFADLIKKDEANYDADYCDGVAYTGAATLREKCALASGYGGIMIWEITLDADGEYSLLGVIKEELLTPANGFGTQPDDDKTDSSGTQPENDKTTSFWILISGVIVLAVFAVAMVAVILIKKKIIFKK